MDHDDRLLNGSRPRSTRDRGAQPDPSAGGGRGPAGREGEGQLEARYDPGSEAVEFVLRRGKGIYRIAANLRHDLHDRGLTSERFLEILLSAGEILAMPAGATDLDRRLEEDTSFSFIFASVLSRNLLARALGLSAEQVKLLAEPAPESRPTACGETFPCKLVDSEPLTAETARGLPLGEVLIRLGTDALAVAWGLRKQVYGDNRPIGEILVTGGRVRAELCDEAVRLQQGAETPRPWAKSLRPRGCPARMRVRRVTGQHPQARAADG